MVNYIVYKWHLPYTWYIILYSNGIYLIHDIFDGIYLIHDILDCIYVIHGILHGIYFIHGILHGIYFIHGILHGIGINRLQRGSITFD